MLKIVLVLSFPLEHRTETLAGGAVLVRHSIWYRGEHSNTCRGTIQPTRRELDGGDDSSAAAGTQQPCGLLLWVVAST
ncbi:hypothetical protein BV25DRAFT_129168 [Artomyces pyxidatus]|uniref:Uncharacterized protein n=1 Tax=Artomyces pyxidatus TaxID=48021 RepID=A0ACB8T918_9AGAM|nr:hypothetical protein BV25DRAFT_129168 [Artomyces pyxidatus]